MSDSYQRKRTNTILRAKPSLPPDIVNEIFRHEKQSLSADIISNRWRILQRRRLIPPVIKRQRARNQYLI